jgi:RNA polymerase sigma-70 factor (ECF subfamily)
MHMFAASDEALIAGLAAGDRGAATAFVRRFQSRVFGLAVTMVGDAAVAEEISQEAFTRAWRHAGAYDARRGRVPTWLLSITRNLAIDHLRAKRTEPLDPDAIGEADRAMWATSAGSSVDQHIETTDLRGELEQLPTDQRRALLLAALFGYTAREIGEIEQIPLGTAKTRIRTAMLKLGRDVDNDDTATEADSEQGGS